MIKQEPIRILQCVSNMDRAGIETMLMNYYRNIDRNKVQFDFLCNKSKPGDYDDEIKSLGGKIFISPGLSPFKWFKYQRFLKNIFKENPEYKIIHCQNEAMGFPALYAAKKAGIPVRISHSHNTVTRFDFKWPIKILYKYLLRFVATDYVACGIDAGRYLFGREVKVIHNAIDVDKFKFDEKVRNKIRKELNVDNKFLIGHVGRFEPQKNHDFLIDIFYEYQKIDKDAVLLLIGTGNLEDKIKEKIKLLRIDNKVIFTGNISNVNEMYNAIDLFILPSLHEGLPVVGVESQANKLPTLISDKVTREIKVNDNIEFLPINNVDIWLKKIAYYKKIGRSKNSKIIEAGYDINEESKNIVIWYKKLFDFSKK